MKRTQKLMVVVGCLLIGMAAKGQNNWSYPTPSGHVHSHYSKMYVGIHLDSPLFWGDLYSLGDKTRLGIGGGFFLGYAFNDWFSSEVVLAYGEGYLGAKSYQKDYTFTQEGLINYVRQSPTDRKLGDVYSKVAYAQTGLRLQVRLLELLMPKKHRTFDIEVAPAFYLQKFYPRLYDEHTDTKLGNWGIGENDLSYAVGGDIGITYNLSSHHSLFLRGGLLWMDNDEFDGVNPHPVWRVNLMANVAVGIRFHLYN